MKNKNTKTKIFFYTLAVVCAVIIIGVTYNKLTGLIEYIRCETGQNSSLSDVIIDKTNNPLLLVNSRNKYEKQPMNLVSVYENKTKSYLVKDKNVQLKKEVIEALNSMMDDFKKETGLSNVNVISGYRSIEDQKKLYEKYLLSHGKSYTEKYVQQPGFSEHHTGYAVDFSIYHTENGSSEDFKGQREYRWISQNAWRYGFILRYPEEKADLTGIAYEPWHFRFVGKKAAKYITENDLCLEEYVSRHT
ncbi:MAG: D-alanyl-D-alanine carboxypeptidase family protein [Acutalibacteraceae bacterium]